MSDNRLCELHADAAKKVEELGPQFNWVLKFECAAQELRNLEISNVRAAAEGWRSETPPPDYYFSHAQYYKDGVAHIINELTKKPTSNRALYSLISQDDIRDSHDGPIPSFMILQCQLDNEALYCTAYFRALEVSNFLKINLEEIRQTLVEIYEGCPRFSTVKWTIFAFHAYVDHTRSTLRRPRLESLDTVDLIELLAQPNALRELDAMLKELHEAITIVPEKLENLRKVLEKKRQGIAVHEKLGDRLLINQLDIAIDAAKSLRQLRCQDSRGDAVVLATNRYQQAISEMRRHLDA